VTLQAISAREASIFACLVDTVVQPDGGLPPVARTDAVEFFDRWLIRSPRQNRLGLRAVLYAAELGPLATGFGRRLRRLGPDERFCFVRRVEKTRSGQLRQIAKLVKSMAYLCYYGDDELMRRAGYDAEANLRRGRELRARDGRP
jgi:hypothetical protein